MVVNSVRDYLRKMSEGPEKPPLVPRGPVRMPSPGIHDGSTVSNSTKDNITSLCSFGLGMVS
jgi:hypothetical protein